MQTRDNGKQSEEGEERRDLELENLVGNLFIPEYQVDRLRARLADLVEDFRPKMVDNNNKTSAHVFKHNNKWYKLSLRINKTNADSAN
jgi:hypothetical protein